MRFSTNTGVIGTRVGVVKAVRMIAEAGFPCADISMITPYDVIADWDIASVAGELTAISSSTGIRYNQAHAPFSSNYMDMLEKVVPLFPKAFELCEMLGIPSIVVHPLKDYDRLYSDNAEEMFDANVSFFNSLSPLAAQHGVKIAIENMFHRHPVSRVIGMGICGTPEEHIRLYESIDNKENFTLCLDIGHSVLTMQDPARVVKELGRDRLTCLHVQDLDTRDDLHQLPGLSKIDFEPILKALGEIDYCGEFTLEIDNFFKGFSDEMLPHALSFAAKVAGSMADKIDYYRK